MIKVERNKLNIVRMSELIVAKEMLKMTFCENVIVFIVDELERLIGVITKKDYDRSDIIEECINRKPVKAYKSEKTETLIRKLFYFSKTSFIPVVNEDERLLCCYFKSDINRLLPHEADMENAILLEEYNKKCAQFQKNEIYILTDIDVADCLGLKDKIVTLEQLSDFESCSNAIFLLIFSEAYMYPAAISEMKRHNLKYIGACGCFRSTRNAMEGAGGVTDYMSLDKTALEVLRLEYTKGGYYYSLPDMENICQIIKATRNVTGSYVEIGVFRGDTARFALEYMHRSGIKRKSYFLDTFSGFTYDAANSSRDVIWAGTHTTTSYELVKKRLEKYHAECCVCNIIEDELPDAIGEIAVCNIDVDMEEAVKASLYKVRDRMASGGIIIAEDYGHMPALAGANYAVNQFISENENMFTSLYYPSGQMLLIRK